MGDAPSITFRALGAADYVGRSCFILQFGQSYRVMLDFGAHVARSGRDQVPKLPSDIELDTIDCVVISHFHLDHIGALPFLTNQLQYKGPIFMTSPTLGNAPVILEDYMDILKRQSGRPFIGRPEDITRSLDRVTPIHFYERVAVTAGLNITMYPAGHLLGAGLIHVETDVGSAVYTGDFNIGNDRHLPPAFPPYSLRPDVLISESTYGCVVRDKQEYREQQFLHDIVATMEKGGRVLIPTFALGRAQDACIMLEHHWERHGLKYPIIAIRGLIEKATALHVRYRDRNWMHPSAAAGGTEDASFKHIKLVDPSNMDLRAISGPIVVLSSPSSLANGLTRSFFEAWCDDPDTLVVVPGYHNEGTPTDKIIRGEVKSLSVDNGPPVEIKCTVRHLSFAAHADMRSIAAVAETVQPSSVILVHGRRSGLAAILEAALGVKVYCPKETCMRKGYDRRREAMPECPTATVPVLSGVTGILRVSDVTPMLAMVGRDGVGMALAHPRIERGPGCRVRVVSDSRGSRFAGQVAVKTSPADIEQFVDYLRAELVGSTIALLGQDDAGDRLIEIDRIAWVAVGRGESVCQFEISPAGVQAARAVEAGLAIEAARQI